VKNQIVVRDSITTNFEAMIQQNFHTYKGNSYFDHKANHVYVANPSVQLKFHHNKEDEFLCRKNPLRAVDNQNFMGLNVQRSVSGKAAEFTTWIDIEPL
jgi:hypothetical protein